MRFNWARWAPPGMQMHSEMLTYGYGGAFAALYALVHFAVAFGDAHASLYVWEGGRRVILEGTLMPDFAVLFDGALTGFAVLALIAAGFLLWHYRYHYFGSKSIYLMRRLPDPTELHRRCLAIPVAVMIISAVLALMILLICYGIYMVAAPEQCIAPEQWQKIWSVR